MRIVSLVLIAITIGCEPAHASGGIGCEGADEALKFAGRERHDSRRRRRLLQLRAELDVRLPSTPGDFRKLPLDGADLMHHWVDDRELKLLLYRERTDGPFGWVRLLIETRRVDEGAYAGSYLLTIGNMGSAQASEPTMREARGEATCFAE
jgi:hypothetical protein